MAGELNHPTSSTLDCLSLIASTPATYKYPRDPSSRLTPPPLIHRWYPGARKGTPPCPPKIARFQGSFKVQAALSHTNPKSSSCLEDHDAPAAAQPHCRSPSLADLCPSHSPCSVCFQWIPHVICGEASYFFSAPHRTFLLHRLLNSTALVPTPPPVLTPVPPLMLLLVDETVERREDDKAEGERR
ncbi:unnamed protein product [Urochloa humidicola]